MTLSYLPKYVSIPLRQAKNAAYWEGKAKENFVSIPLRQAKNYFTENPENPTEKVSIPLRQAKNPIGRARYLSVVWSFNSS